MTREELDAATYNQELGASSSTTLEVDTSRAEDLLLLVDNGTTGGTPNTYSLVVRVYSDEFDDYQQFTDVSSNSDFSHEFTAYGTSMEVEITDTSSAAATRRITLESYRTLD